MLYFIASKETIVRRVKLILLTVTMVVTLLFAFQPPQALADQDGSSQGTKEVRPPPPPPPPPIPWYVLLASSLLGL